MKKKQNIWIGIGRETLYILMNSSLWTQRREKIFWLEHKNYMKQYMPGIIPVDGANERLMLKKSIEHQKEKKTNKLRKKT